MTIIDSGLDSMHLWSGTGDGPAANYVDCLYVSTAASSCYDQQTSSLARGHGAHVAGIIAGKDNASGNIGIASSPNLFASINVCGTGSSCPLPAVAQAIDWAIDETIQGHRPRHIVSISIGHCTGGTAISEAVTAAWNAGILVVASAGNTRPDCSDTQLRFPAAYTPVIAVGGSLEDDTFAAPGASASCIGVGQAAGSVSSAGIDLVAPFSATSLWAGGQYSFQCGTSMSAPVVSGVAALLWTRYPTWSNSQIRSRLESSAQFVGSAAHFGHGRVDPLNALYGYTPLVAYVSGPQTVTQPGQHTWDAYVTGGPASYAYFWSRSTSGPEGPYTSLGAASSQSLQVDEGTAYEFWLRLEVTSGAEFSTDAIRIVNETSNPCAPLVCARAPGERE